MRSPIGLGSPAHSLEYDRAYLVVQRQVPPADHGFDTQAELGFALLPETPMAHTASGGLHLYFESPDRIEIRNTAGAYGPGIRPQLDTGGEGGPIILPSPG